MAEYRLPAYIKPLVYKLSLNLQALQSQSDSLVYTGLLTLQLDIQKPAQQVLLNCEDPVAIKAIKATHPFQAPLEYQPLSHSRLRIDLPQPIQGACTLQIAFEARVLSDLYGCYQSSNALGASMITSHFEPIYARKALPCFDEPSFKSVFKLSVRVDSPLQVISNMPVRSQRPDGAGVVFSFQRTPLMSCYLLHWTICQHESISTTLACGTQLSLYASPTDSSAAYLQLAKESFQYYVKYFQVDYPLPKLDLIAVFKMSVRAMQNWGAITFKDGIIMQERGQNPHEFVRNCRTVCHEISHMWFGNLVTMEWWTYLWLNEGFARFMEHKCLEAIRPQFKVWEKFLPDVLGLALAKDRSLSTHPIEVECADQEKISSIFDAISYNKGASVVRMLEDSIGEEPFRRGISEYMHTYQYANTTTEMLWEALNKYTQVDVGQMMQVWVQKEGYPYVTVSRGAHGFELTQQRLGAPSEEVWHIPLRYLTSEGRAAECQFTERHLVLPESCSWVKLNHGAKGVYLVKYEQDLLAAICEDVRGLGNEDRYMMIYECWTFWKMGMAPFASLGRLIEACLPEYDYIVFKLITDILSPMMRQGYLHDQGFVRFIKKVAYPIWERHTVNLAGSDDFDATALCHLSYKWLVDVCNEEAVQEALIELKNRKGLPEAFEDCYMLSLINRRAQESLDIAKSDLKFACDLLSRSADESVLKEVIRHYRGSHLAALYSSYKRLDKRDGSCLAIALLAVMREDGGEDLFEFASYVVLNAHIRRPSEVRSALEPLEVDELLAERKLNMTLFLQNETSSFLSGEAEAREFFYQSVRRLCCLRVGEDA